MAYLHELDFGCSQGSPGMEPSGHSFKDLRMLLPKCFAWRACGFITLRLRASGMHCVQARSLWTRVAVASGNIFGPEESQDKGPLNGGSPIVFCCRGDGGRKGVSGRFGIISAGQRPIRASGIDRLFP